MAIVGITELRELRVNRAASAFADMAARNAPRRRALASPVFQTAAAVKDAPFRRAAAGGRA